MKSPIAPVAKILSLAILGSGCAFPFGGESDIETSAASAAVGELLESVLERPDAGADVGLDACPFDADGALLAEAVSGIESPDVDRSMSDRSIATASVNAIDGGFLLCIRFDPESESVIGMDVSSAPDDFESYLQNYLDPFDQYADGSADGLTVERSAVDYRGGTLHQICVEYSDSPATNFCEVDWVNDDLLVAVYVVGPETGDLNVEALQQGLSTVLPEITSNLETVANTPPDS